MYSESGMESRESLEFRVESGELRTDNSSSPEGVVYDWKNSIKSGIFDDSIVVVGVFVVVWDGSVGSACEKTGKFKLSVSKISSILFVFIILVVRSESY